MVIGVEFRQANTMWCMTIANVPSCANLKIVKFRHSPLTFGPQKITGSRLGYLDIGTYKKTLVDVHSES